MVAAQYRESWHTSSQKEGILAPKIRNFRLSECGWKVSLPPALVLPELLSNDGFAAHKFTVDVEIYKDGVSGTCVANNPLEPG